MPLLERDPDIHQLVPFDRRRWGTPSGWPEAFQTILRLREEHFDWVIDLQSLARSALLGWTVGGSLTVGLADSREGAPAFFDFAVPRPFPRAHAVDWYLEVLRTLNVPVHLQFDWLPQNAEARTVVESIWPSEGARWVALQPGARWDNKRWPVEFYAELAVQLLGEVPDLRVVVLGGNSDRALGKIIAARAGQRCIDLTGRLTLPTLVEWLRRSSLLVTNDTGPMHLAAAVSCPVVALFGPTDPGLTGPYGQPDAVIQLDLECRPCQKPTCQFRDTLACLRHIPVFQVLSKVRQRLAERGQVWETLSTASQSPPRFKVPLVTRQ